MGAGHVTRFAQVDFRGDKRIFGIKDEDRLLHVYIIGKTATGKSTLLENMALQDLERGHGFTLIDPHGDLVGRIAARITASGRHDVIYLDATDPSQPFGFVLCAWERQCLLLNENWPDGSLVSSSEEAALKILFIRIRLVEQSTLPVRRTLDKIGIPRRLSRCKPILN